MTLDIERHRYRDPYTEQDYLVQTQQLLPKGTIWDFLIGSGSLLAGLLFDASSTEFGNLLSCIAAECKRVGTAAVQLANEAIPGLSVDLLEEWESILGLPDECELPENYDTLEKRQELAHNKFFGEFPVLNRAHTLAIANHYGFDISVEELSLQDDSFVMGTVIMGSNQLGGQASYAILQITINSGTGDLDRFKCRMVQELPAHTVIAWVEP